MNSEQIELIQSSWKKVLPIADTAADLFYNRLFEVAPAVRELFPDDMKEQKKNLLATLGRVVSSLHNLDNIVPAVQELGIRHIGYGTKPEHYPVVGDVLLWTLEQGLGEEWNEDLKEAWATAYGILADAMIKAAEDFIREENLSEDGASAAAEANAEAPVEAHAEARVESAAERKKAKKRKKRSGGSSIAAAATGSQTGLDAEQASGPHRQLVVFDLDEEEYGLDISAVREIIRLQEITSLPRAPKFVEGVINLRGKVTPVVSLRSRFGMEEVERDDDFRIVVVQVGEYEIGMIVDAVTEVSRVAESAIEPPSSVVMSEDADYITGIAKTGDAMIILLDIGKLVMDTHGQTAEGEGLQQAA